MNGAVFDYAGSTSLAYLAFALAAGVVLALVVLEAILLVRIFKFSNAPKSAWMRRFAPALFPVPLVALWLGAAWLVGPRLDHAWLYLQENASRAYSTYAGLTFATAFLPTFSDAGRGAFIHVATRDTGFAKGSPVSVQRKDGHVLARYVDEDYPGDVMTMDGRPVDTGFRYRHVRACPALISLFVMPGAKSARVLGAEAEFYSKPFAEAGLKILDASAKTPSDIVLVAPEPDWIVGSDFPDRSFWQKVSGMLTKTGVAALHLDARLLSRSRLKGMTADFRAVFGHYFLWCVGRNDYVVTSADVVLADEVFDLFANPKTFAPFASAELYTPVEVLSCYVGSDYEVEPGLLDIPASGHVRATWTAPKLAFSPPPTNHFAAVRVAEITPYGIPWPSWFQRGIAVPGIYTVVSNGYLAVQAARREFLVGIDDADRGVSTNALAHWERGARINPNDPLLRALADALDLEGRRYLRIGNANGAIQCYENRLAILTNDVAAVHNFGVCLKKSGHPDMAASVFARAVQMDPLVDEHRYELIETCAASSHEDIACRQLDVLMKRHPNDPALMLRAAKLLCRKTNKARDIERAIRLAEEAVRLTNWKDSGYVLGLADVYIESGRLLMGMGLKKKMREMKFDR